MDKVILHWSYRDLRELPLEMQDYRDGLEEIYLKENFLTCLPAWLFDFQHLKFINLTGNLINELPDEIVLLKNLEVLVLSKNSLHTLPSTIRHMHNLKELLVNDNRLKVLPKEIGELNSLEILDCSQNLLLHIPKSIKMCLSLREINLDGNRQLQELPSCLFNLPQLTYISANQCDLRCLPFTITAGKLNFVRVFQNNSITHIPLAFEKFVLEPNNLWDIDFKIPISFFHCIYDIPSKLSISKQLRKLKFSSDNILSLYEICLRHAHFLNLHKHGLPEYVKSDILMGSIGQCGNTRCNNYLFNECFLLLMNRRKNFSGILFSQIFCSQFCIDQWCVVNNEQYAVACWPQRMCSNNDDMEMDTL